MQNVILDFEFTGLDNSFIKDNEIIQAKAMNVATGEIYFANYFSDKAIGAHAYLTHQTERYTSKDSTATQKFSKQAFELMISKLSLSDSDIRFHGFSVSQDLLMLKKYGIDVDINDIQQALQLSDFEYRIATEGRSLECVYYIVTGKIPKLKNHYGIDELHVIKELYDVAASITPNTLLFIMPHGHCAGMPIVDYVAEYRRAADGYRFNNYDILAKSLNEAISNQESGFPQYFEDDDEFGE